MKMSSCWLHLCHQWMHWLSWRQPSVSPVMARPVNNVPIHFVVLRDFIIYAYQNDSLSQQHLTHWGPDKMFDILKKIFSNAHSLMKICVSWFKFHWLIGFFFTCGSIDGQSSLVQVMAWQQMGAKPLPEPMMTQINSLRPSDAYMSQ